MRLSAKKPVPRAYPKEIRTIGDHVRRRRLDLKMTQKQVAEIISVDESTVWNWESNRTEPLIRHLPIIFLFLGYSPFSTTGQSLGERLQDYRRKTGFSRKKVANAIGTDPGTLGKIEKNDSGCSHKVIRKAINFLSRADSRKDQ